MTSKPQQQHSRLPRLLFLSLGTLLFLLIVQPLFAATITGHVWTDLDENGLRDSREPPVPGFLVELLDSRDNVVDSVKTDEEGRYELSAEDGQFRVRFDKKSLPGGFDFTDWKTEDDRSPNSDANPYSGVTPRIDLTPSGDDVSGIDAGIKGGGRITGVVWNDQDLDGEVEGEPKLEGVLIDLYAIGQSNITFVTRARSTPEGYYSMKGLPAGLYLLELRKMSSGLPRVKLTTEGARVIKLGPKEERRGTNFGLVGLPPPTVVADFTAEEAFDGTGVDLRWTTSSEFDPLAFRMYRSTSRKGERELVKHSSGSLLLARDHSQGASYELFDRGVTGAAEEYFYWLETIDQDFVSTVQGPYGLAQEIAAAGRLPLGETGLTLMAIPEGASYEVRVNGVVVPSVVTSRGLLARIPPSRNGGPEPDVELIPAVDPERMEVVDAMPRGVSFESIYMPSSGYTRLPTPVEAERYLVVGNGGSLYAVDLQNPDSPKLLDAPVLEGDSLSPALYLSIPEDGDVIVMEEFEKGSAFQVKPRQGR